MMTYEQVLTIPDKFIRPNIQGPDAFLTKKVSEQVTLTH